MKTRHLTSNACGVCVVWVQPRQDCLSTNMIAIDFALEREHETMYIVSAVSILMCRVGHEPAVSVGREVDFRAIGEGGKRLRFVVHWGWE